MKKLFLISALCSLPPLRLGGPAIVLVAGLSALSHASGTTSLHFLKLEGGARQAAMGGGSTALADDVNAMRHNPAALGNLDLPEAGFLYADYYEDVSFEHLAGAIPTRAGNFGFQFTSLTYGEITEYDNNDNKLGHASVNDLSVGLSYGADIGGGFSAGGSAHFLREHIIITNATGWSFDLGLHYQPQTTDAFWSHVRAGLAVENLGPAVKFIDEHARLPTQLVTGIALQDWKDQLTLYTELHAPNEGDPYMGLGGEYWWKKRAALRAGYLNQTDTGSGLSLGGGYRWRGMQIDYAWMPYGDLGSAHRIGLLYRFGTSSDKNLAVRPAASLEKTAITDNGEWSDSPAELPQKTRDFWVPE